MATPVPESFSRMYVHLPSVGRQIRVALSPRRTTWRRALVSGAYAFVLYPSIAVSVAAMRGLDLITARRFRRVEVKEPVFVISNPRSGTTFLHRLLCLDEERFTWLKLWQTIVPSVSGYRVIGALAKIDPWLGRPLGRMLGLVERLAFGGWDGVHNMGFRAAEEEEAWFTYTWVTAANMMFFPDPDALDYLSFLDDMPPAVRRRVMAFHRANVQRHLFAAGDGRQFLSKNVFMSGRVESVLETYPDARIIQIVRHPYEALPSFCSMFTMPWGVHSPEIAKDSDTARYWARLGARFYQRLLELSREMPPDRFCTVRYDHLLDDPVGTVETIYAQMGWEMSDAHRARLEADAARRTKNYQSKHSYSLEEYGLTKDWIRDELGEVMDAWGFEP